MKLKEKLFSVLNNKCPKCHNGPVFEVNNPYNLKRFDKMYKSCTWCGETYHKEPGFYYGAMIVSYMLNGALFIFTFLGIYIPMEIDAITYIVTMGALIVILAPLTFRLSRLVWLNVFVGFDPAAKCINPAPLAA